MPDTQTPRKDQQRNRRRLLDAAHDLFLAEGPDVSLEAIARKAGVGTTTLYRHFSTKDELVRALLDELGSRSQQVADQAARISDPWEAFGSVFSQGCVLDAADLALFDALCRTSPAAAELGHRAVTALLDPVARRARKAGRLRRDVTLTDIATLMRMADSAIFPTQRTATIKVMLDGLDTAATRHH